MKVRRRDWVLIGAISATLCAAALLVVGRRAEPRAEAASEAAPTRGPNDPLRLSQGGATLETTTVARAPLVGDIQVVGSVATAENHFAVVGPSVSGRIRRLLVGVGDQVKAGQLLGEIESVEAGQARGDYIAAKAALAAAEANAIRERELADKQISSNRERELAAAQAVSQRAKMRAAMAHLRAIGFNPEEIRRLEQEGTEGALIPLRAPIGGRIIKRTVTLGQSIERSMDAFTIADLSHLWVLLDIYEQDLARVHPGQRVSLRSDVTGGEVFEARVAYVDPIVDERTRTAHVRIAFDNGRNKLRLHQLVTARIIGDAAHASEPVLVVPSGALERVDGNTIVFVKKRKGFEKRVIEAGSSGGDMVEVRAGLQPGEEVAMAGAFLLKSELLR